jgi:hypothetical protein
MPLFFRMLSYVCNTPYLLSPYVSAVVFNSVFLSRTDTNLHTCHTAHSCDLVLLVIS